MPQGPDGKTIIIVKKVAGHGGHHGGSWKVAYADFVTSMMAFFMVLWLVSTASVKTREQIAYYFRKPGVFIKGSGTPLETGGAGILPEAFAPPAEGNSQIQPHRRIYTLDESEGMRREVFGTVEGKAVQNPFDKLERDLRSSELPSNSLAVKQLAGTKAELEKVAAELRDLVSKEKSEMGGALGSVAVTMDHRGLHLDIMDTSKASMFQRGSSSIENTARDQLVKIAKLLVQLPNPIDIEGHTDAVPYSLSMSRRYDNWDLSVDRANAARRILMQMGFKDAQFARVVGYAAQRPRLPKDPMNPTNRRITISMRYTEQAAKTLSGTPAVETRPVPISRQAADGVLKESRESSQDVKVGDPKGTGSKGAPTKIEGIRVDSVNQSTNTAEESVKSQLKEKKEVDRSAVRGFDSPPFRPLRSDEDGFPVSEGQ